MKYFRGLQVIGTKSDLEKAMAYEGLPMAQREELKIASMKDP
jgi:hypothetical protein